MRKGLYLNSTFSTVLIFTVTFIYFRLLPTDVETQPIFILGIALFLSFSHLKYFKYVNFDEVISLLIILIVLCLGMASFFTYGSSGLIESMKLVIGPSLYIFFRRLKYQITNWFFLFFYLLVCHISCRDSDSR